MRRPESCRLSLRWPRKVPMQDGLLTMRLRCTLTAHGPLPLRRHVLPPSDDPISTAALRLTSSRMEVWFRKASSGSANGRDFGAGAAKPEGQWSVGTRWRTATATTVLGGVVERLAQRGHEAGLENSTTDRAWHTGTKRYGMSNGVSALSTIWKRCETASA
jgi:hypothetical protein